jgi:uncharacterized lipoprotein YddW (UPF0748 family)
MRPLPTPAFLATALLALAASSGRAWGQAPGVPRPPVPALFDFKNPEEARNAWKPMAGSPEVALVPVEGRTVLTFQCPFQGTSIERASWDCAVHFDLRWASAVSFQFLSSDASAVSQFSLYFRSGGGWYAGSFSPSRKGWSEVVVRKRDLAVEGAPRGWEELNAVRISAWRGRDENASFCLASFRVRDADAPVAVVRAESGGIDPKQAAEYAGRTAAFLEEAGAAPCFLSEPDVCTIPPGKLRVVILPFNPELPDRAVDRLLRFLEEGGRIVAFYQLPAELRAAAGIEAGPWLRPRYPGQFACIRPVSGELPGAPGAVRQRSWNIQAARPVEGRSRAAAMWCDEKGDDTGEPAIVVSKNCAWVTHVLLADDPEGKRRLLLALVGLFAPEVWKPAARRGIERIGRVGPAETLEGLEGLLRGEAGGAGRWPEALRTARDLHEEAELLWRQAKYVESIGAADRAREASAAAWCLGQKPKPGEHRGFWCHSAAGVEGMSWDQAVQALADNGFTAVLPNMLWGGLAYYESAVLPVAPEVREKGDRLAQCLAACKRRRVACHVWKVNWNLAGRAPKEFADRMRREGRTQVRFDGKPEGEWLCPSHPENRALEIEAMVEVAAKYEVDGIHFDYIRYPGAECCFCAGCRERFEKSAGVKVGKWPADLRSDRALAEKWLEFRRANISAVVEAVSGRARKARPGIKVSAAVFTNWTIHRNSIGQDWKLWCDRGWLDFVCPMDYTESEAEFESLAAMQKEWAGKAACYPGIGLSCWGPGDEAVRVIGMIRAARKLGLPGFTVFNLGPREVREVLPWLGKGITARP